MGCWNGSAQAVSTTAATGRPGRTGGLTETRRRQGWSNQWKSDALSFLFLSVLCAILMLVFRNRGKTRDVFRSGVFEEASFQARRGGQASEFGRNLIFWNWRG